MKKILLGLLCLPFLIAATFNQAAPNQSDPAVYKLMEIVYLWDLVSEGYEADQEQDGTWLDVGLRSKYAMARKYASLELLEAAFGQSVFVRGPHQGDMDFNSNTSFGYYNPAFLRDVKETIEAALQHPGFAKVAKGVYEKHFKSMALTYQDAYHYMHDDQARLESLRSEYLLQLAEPEGVTGGSFQETFRSYADNGRFSNKDEEKAYKLKNPNEDWYEKVTAPGFWLRRSIDGTSDQMYSILNMVITKMEE